MGQPLVNMNFEKSTGRILC